MVYAELSHNPYLLQTTVKFNGQSPRINSQIEKYESQILKNWVHKVPQIFYDEMNGYDFDLYFTGTKPDFDDVVHAFSSAGISSEQVRLFHKNEIENATIKSQEIDELICWLKSHPNRKFNQEYFFENHDELFEGSYSFVVINGDGLESFDSQITIDAVDDANEIAGTLLTSTPILFVIDDDKSKQFRTDLLTLLDRKDIQQHQLFFLIHPHINIDQMTRVIRDLGVDSPQIVSKLDDEQILAYMRNYPITEYIRDAIQAFESSAAEINAILEKENQESAVLNAEIHAEIDCLEYDITRLKATDDYFTERDNFYTPPKFEELLENFENQIKKWRNRKTKVVGDSEAEIAAREYDTDLQKFTYTFSDGLRKEYQNICINIFQKFKEHYSSQGIDANFVPKNIFWQAPDAFTISPISKELLTLKEITYEEPKTDIFNMFIKSNTKEDKTPVRVATCYYEHWRNMATELILPDARQYVDSSTATIRHYYDSLAEAFHSHLEDLINIQAKKKEIVSDQLSDDERKLQEDNDWLAEFKDQLHRIERD